MLKKFILVVDEDIVADMTVPESPKFQDYIDALSNNPKFIEVPVDSEIDTGWGWDGTNFFPPVE